MSGGLRISDAAVEAAARKRAEHYESEYDSTHLKWQDFAGEAREILEAALPHLPPTDDGAAAPPAESTGVAPPAAAESATPTAAPSSSAPIASRERVAEVLHAHRIEAFNGSQAVCECDLTWRKSAEYREHLADALLAAGVFRDEATVKAEVTERIAAVAEEYADELEPPTTSEWLELRDWFKGQLHEVAAKAYEIGGK